MRSVARLRRSGDIAAVRSEGRTVRERYFSLRSRPNGLVITRIAVSAPRTLGSAVARNRARRRIREAFRTELASDGRAGGRDMVVTVQPGALSAGFSALRATARAALAADGGTAR